MITMGDNAFTPNWTVHPGEILLDFIENHGLTNKQVAARMNVSVETVKDILAGAAITRQTASLLSKATGMSVKFWLGVESDYVRDIGRLMPADRSIFKNLGKFLIMRGNRVSVLKDAFIKDVVVNDPDHGYEKAAALKEAEDYTIFMELYRGKFHYQVAVGASCGTYVALGPNIVKGIAAQALNTNPAPVVDMARSYPVEYAGT